MMEGMMRTDPSPGELGRRLDDLSSAIQRLMSQDLFIAEQRVGERRFISIERDLEELRRRLDEEFRALATKIETQERDRGTNWRQSFYAGIIPAALLLVSLFVQIWLSLNGSA
ncbi:hypothetical protein [Streptosporangium sp. KLBMP 9127]|nr:hypothetical protein [Streptosporangium sp. KLBMP 9127]